MTEAVDHDGDAREQHRGDQRDPHVAQHAMPIEASRGSEARLHDEQHRPCREEQAVKVEERRPSKAARGDRCPIGRNEADHGHQRARVTPSSRRTAASRPRWSTRG